MNKWDRYFFDIAKRTSEMSKDRTKIGAAIMRPDKSLASTGFNGLVPGMDDEKFLKDREFKNLIVRHAEENAIWFARHPDPKDCTMYLYGLLPCGRCASAIIMSGIKRLNYVISVESAGWNASCDAGQIAFNSCGLEIYNCTKEYVNE